MEAFKQRAYFLQAGFPIDINKKNFIKELKGSGIGTGNINSYIIVMFIDSTGSGIGSTKTSMQLITIIEGFGSSIGTGLSNIEIFLPISGIGSGIGSGELTSVIKNVILKSFKAQGIGFGTSILKIIFVPIIYRKDRDISAFINRKDRDSE